MYNAQEKNPLYTIGVHTIIEVVVPQPEMSHFTITIDIARRRYGHRVDEEATVAVVSST
jgi:hypothetical protein